MPKAKKLPSGSWRCQVLVNGKRKSFTVEDPSPRGRRKCEALAAQYAEEAHIRKKYEKTVDDAIADYIESRKGTISVTTITAYKSMQEHAYGDIKDMLVADIGAEDLQRWVDAFAAEHSSKYCTNALGLLLAAIQDAVGIRFAVRGPKKKTKALYTPTDEDIKNLLSAVAGTDLEKAVMLAAFGTLRAGEVCALTKDDIRGNTISVNKSMAYDGEKYIIKSPKTEDSVRDITLPEEVIGKLTAHEDGRIVAMNPKELSWRFGRALRRTGIRSFRFHDLRAYAASIRHAMGIPDIYIMADGGWKTDSVLRRVYLRAMEDKRKEFSAVANRHFAGLMDGDPHEEKA